MRNSPLVDAKAWKSGGDRRAFQLLLLDRTLKATRDTTKCQRIKLDLKLAHLLFSLLRTK